MRSRSQTRWVGLVLAPLLVAIAPLVVSAQGDRDDQATLTLNNVKERLKQNKEYLKQAKQHARRGDAAGVNTALENYERSMEGLNRAMQEGRVEGDESGREEAFERVERATRKHGEVLADLLNKVPEQARPAVERAMEQSQHGRATALQNLERVRTMRQEREAAQMRQRTGQPEGVGRPGRTGGPATGPKTPAGGAGRPGGRPSGGPPGGGPG